MNAHYTIFFIISGHTSPQPINKIFIFTLTARESKYRGKKCKIIGTIPKHSKN